MSKVTLNTTQIALISVIGCLSLVSLCVIVYYNRRGRKNENYWAQQVAKYERAARFLNSDFDKMTAYVAECVAGKDRVLELAAGTGMVSTHVVQRVGHLTATDFDDGMLRALRERLPARVAIEKADATQLQFDDETFDVVIAANVLHLLPQPDLVLQEAHRVLARGGLFIAPTFLHGNKTSSQVLSRLMAATGFPVQHRFSQQSYISLFEQTHLNNFVLDRRLDQFWDGKLPLMVLVAVKN